MLRNIKQDKWKHFFVGIAMGGFLQALVFWLLPDSFVMATVIAAVIVVAISYGFELFSKITGLGHYDIYDALASIIGGLIGMIIIALFQLN